MSVAVNALSPEQFAATYSPRTHHPRLVLTDEEVRDLTRGVPMTITNAPVKPATYRAANRLAAEAAHGRIGRIQVDGTLVRYLDGVTWMIAGELES